MQTLTIPLSGQLLVAHLAAYGLGFALDVAGEQAFVGHDPESLEMDPQISTTADLMRIAECVRNTTAHCEEPVKADLVAANASKDGRPVLWPVIWARATAMARASAVLPVREELLDRLECRGARVATELMAGLGAPAAWLDDKPQRGASRLDGVAGNSTSDFVRGVLRRALPAASSVTADDLQPLWTGAGSTITADDDKTGWSPPGTRVALLYQWLAAVGLSQLPVGLSSHGSSRTPGRWRDAEAQGARLPVLAAPTSMARLRALLQLPELVLPVLGPADAGRLRALGIQELVSFPLLNRSNGNMVAFSFGRATRLEL